MKKLTVLLLVLFLFTILDIVDDSSQKAKIEANKIAASVLEGATKDHRSEGLINWEARYKVPHKPPTDPY